MYKITILDQGVDVIIHYQSIGLYPYVTDMKLKNAENQSSVLTFKISIVNPSYKKIVDLVTRIKVVDTRNNNIIFEGRILSSVENMDSSGSFYKDVACESELGYLNDSRVGRWEFHPGILPENSPVYAEPNQTIQTVMTKLINNHNSNTDTHKHFTLGNVESSDGVYFTTNYESSLDILINKVIISNGLIIKLRYVNNVRYIDVLKDNPRVSNTEISLRKNIKSFRQTPNRTNFCTRLIAIGANGITFEAINNGKNYVEDPVAISKYGIITKPVEWNNVNMTDILLSKAKSKLSEIVNDSYVSVEVSALDLSYIGLTPEQFEISTKYLVANDIQDFYGTLKVVQINLDLSNPWDSDLTFSNMPISAALNSLSIQQKLNQNRLEALTYNDRLAQQITNSKTQEYAFKKPSVKNGSNVVITLPDPFYNKNIDTDFTVTASYGNFDSRSSALLSKDAVRTIFVQIVSWNKTTKELTVKPCMQKINLDSKTLYGWDSSTTTSGNPIGEGEIDVIVTARI